MGDDRIVLVASGDAWRRQPVPVSATLITYNQEGYVSQALESVLAQTYPLDLVISDDGSSDATRAICERRLQQYAGAHRIRMRWSTANRGVCKNQNAALALAEGELVVLFEGDDVSLPSRVQRIVDTYLARDRRVAAIGSGIRKVDAVGAPVERIIWPDLCGDAWTLTRGAWNVHGCGLAIRRDVFSEVGPISTHLISGDIALWMRAAFVDRGGLAQVPEVLLDYRIHGSNFGSRWTLDYSSLRALRERCLQLLKNEVAQMAELKKIRRYRRVRRGNDPELDRAWQTLFSLVRRRAGLVLTIGTRSRARCVWAALAAFRSPILRGFAGRTLALALAPGIGRLHRRLRGVGRSSAPAAAAERSANAKQLQEVR